jgi:hypothetical protein
VIRNRTERIAGYILYLISGGYQSLKEGNQRDRILISMLLFPPFSVSAEDLQYNIHPAKGTAAPMLPARIDDLIKLASGLTRRAYGRKRTQAWE